MYLSCGIPSRGEVQRRGPMGFESGLKDKKHTEREWQFSQGRVDKAERSAGKVGQ